MNPYPNTKSVQYLAQNERLLSWFDSLRKELDASHQRAIVLLRGPREWGLETVKCFGQSLLLLSNDEAMQGAISFSKAENLLGQEVQCLVYDLFSGLNSDVLCMGAGLIRSGGLLLLLCPQNWTEIDDVYGRWQGGSDQSEVFLDYLIDQWSGGENYYSINPEQTLPEIKPLPISALVEIEKGQTHEQHELIQQLCQWHADKAKPLFLLTADRGRGKSTALGKFASRLADGCEVVITAASRMQVEILLSEVTDISRPSVHFMAPDEIIRRQQCVDTLIIDEAAMLPVSVLQQCIELANKTVLATTTGGYEGTGQGFLLKFMASFNSQQYDSVQLNHAVRWGQNDLLEQAMNNALMLTSSPVKTCQEKGEIRIQLISKAELVKDLALLREIYQLLISAHYRTRPSDLRQLMEDDNQLVVVARDELSIVGVMLLNQEGGFDAELSEQIFMGRRRPQGHLLAQMLTAQAGLKHFSCYRGYRVQRIAVEQNYRRKGVGRRLIDKARQLVDLNQMDYLGSSFSLDQGNAAFWKSCGFQLAHIASGKGKSSGRQTLVVLHSTQSTVVTDMLAMQQKIRQDLALWLLTYCNEMYWADVLVVLSLIQADEILHNQDKEEVEAFAFGFRGLDYALPAIQRFLIAYSAVIARLDQAAQQALIEKILLNRSWEAVLQHSHFAGRKPLLKNLRENIRNIYEHTYEL
jgi:tRNA(Met) cytidine acetyltransferase